MSDLTRYEQETVYRYNQEERFAYCFTYDNALIRKLDKFIENGEEIIVSREGDGWKEYKFPKKCIKVRFPRQLSDEQRQKMAERFKSAVRKENSDGMA